MAKLNGKKRKKSSFYEEKSLVGLTPDHLYNFLGKNTSLVSMDLQQGICFFLSMSACAELLDWKLKATIRKTCVRLVRISRVLPFFSNTWQRAFKRRKLLRVHSNNTWHFFGWLRPPFSYSVFHRFRQAKFANGGSILSTNQILLLSQLP